METPVFHLRQEQTDGGLPTLVVEINGGYCPQVRSLLSEACPDGHLVTSMDSTCREIRVHEPLPKGVDWQTFVDKLAIPLLKEKFPAWKIVRD